MTAYNRWFVLMLTGDVNNRTGEPLHTMEIVSMYNKWNDKVIN